jgi:hypothetical protein
MCDFSSRELISARALKNPQKACCVENLPKPNPTKLSKNKN